ncbi:hypothetical protein NDU88_011562 [Pleurodeles waltl]|uniref:Uncharacterized protein n=1 Tax=Pleurodeles waltl TaxID=8319 RepID=A0AAV7Q5D9_PLEWA|nr:hypothetical protein NDU88_011562 [Pleurodeles waltl]
MGALTVCSARWPGLGQERGGCRGTDPLPVGAELHGRHRGGKDSFDEHHGLMTPERSAPLWSSLERAQSRGLQYSQSPAHWRMVAQEQSGRLNFVSFIDSLPPPL